MSVAEAPLSSRTPGRSRAVSPRFLLSELRLMFGRRRNLAGLVVLAAVPVLISIAVKSSVPPSRVATPPTSSARSPTTASSSPWPR